MSEDIHELVAQAVGDDASEGEEVSLSGEQKREYQRDYMRRRRSNIGGSNSGGSNTKPAEASDREWEVACERAARAARYVVKFPHKVLGWEVCFSDPLWQWENETRGRV